MICERKWVKKKEIKNNAKKMLQKNNKTYLELVEKFPELMEFIDFFNLTQEELFSLEIKIWQHQFEEGNVIEYQDSFWLENHLIEDEVITNLIVKQFNIVQDFTEKSDLFKYKILKMWPKYKKTSWKKHFKYKGRRYKFMRILRSLYRFFKLSKYFSIKPKFLFNVNVLPHINQTTKNAVLTQKITLTSKVIEDEYLHFFYKYNKVKRDENVVGFYKLESSCINHDIDKDLYIYSRNYHKKPYFKLKIARDNHWRVFTTKKTIRKQRYKDFIKHQIKNYYQYLDTYIFLLNFYTKFKMSWFNTSYLKTILKYFILSSYKNKIFILPRFISKYLVWSYFSKRKKYLNRKISKWSYLRYKKFICPWLQRKKRFPKKLKHLLPKNYLTRIITHYDPLSNYIWVNEKKPKQVLNPFNIFKTNFYLKLHMYRYKPD